MDAPKYRAELVPLHEKQAEMVGGGGGSPQSVGIKNNLDTDKERSSRVEQGGVTIAPQK